MKITAATKEKIAKAVIAFCEREGASSRKKLIEGTLLSLALTEEEKKDHVPQSKFNTYRSYTGAAIDTLVAKGTLSISDNLYRLAKEKYVIVKEKSCEKAILRFLKEKAYTRKELFSALDAHFGTDKTAARKDDAMLHSIAGQILATLENNGDVTVKQGVYSLVKAKAASTSEEKDLLFESFHKKLCSMGGEFFERYTAELLERYFLLTGRKVLFCEVKGGSDDGGIDVVVDTEDELGFLEHILIQTKCRERIHVTETEVRGFYGAVCAQDGTRGIFVTTSVFHEGAKKLLATIENCVGIDGEKLFELAMKTSYGIRKTKDGYTLDASVF